MKIFGTEHTITGAEVNRKRVAELEAELEDTHRKHKAFTKALAEKSQAKIAELETELVGYKDKVAKFEVILKYKNKKLALKDKTIHVLATALHIIEENIKQKFLDFGADVDAWGDVCTVQEWIDDATAKAKELSDA